MSARHQITLGLGLAASLAALPLLSIQSVRGQSISAPTESTGAGTDSAATNPSSGGTAPSPFASAPAGPPDAVTTDTQEYCGYLMDKVAHKTARRPVPPNDDVTILTMEGERMCGEGMVRGGILRLRRALLLLDSSNASR